MWGHLFAIPIDTCFILNSSFPPGNQKVERKSPSLCNFCAHQSILSSRSRSRELSSSRQLSQQSFWNLIASDSRANRHEFAFRLANKALSLGDRWIARPSVRKWFFVSAVQGLLLSPWICFSMYSTVTKYDNVMPPSFTNAVGFQRQWKNAQLRRCQGWFSSTPLSPIYDLTDQARKKLWVHGLLGEFWDAVTESLWIQT
jgi:hypothetical protein